MLVQNYESMIAQQMNSLFDRQKSKAIRHRAMSRLMGHVDGLPNLHDVKKSIQIDTRSDGGLQVVRIDEVQGSEGRSADFDSDFRPLRSHIKHRWTSIAQALQTDVSLPAVDLVQVNDVYFVRDGHHRISVAKAIGQVEIDAHVTVWKGAEIAAVPTETALEKSRGWIAARLTELGHRIQEHYAPDATRTLQPTG